MTSRERFEAWAKDNCVRTYKQPGVDEYFWPEAREALRVWQARDPEVRELVEALRELNDSLNKTIREQPHQIDLSDDQYTNPNERRLIDAIKQTTSILAKHESGGE